MRDVVNSLARVRATTFAIVGAMVSGCLPAAAEPNRAGAGETVEQALCRLIDDTASQQHLPAEFLTRLLFLESSFRPTVVSPAGAQGIAQFMPGTARERGLADPFDPEQAIPASGSLLAELVQRFGNRGLAAAAYNGGPARVAAWLAGTGGLPLETQDYVFRITGRSAEEWSDDLRRQGPPAPALPVQPKSCTEVTQDLRAVVPVLSTIALAAVAPWGVQLAGNFSKTLALASFERARARYQDILSDRQPMIIGTRLRTRGFGAFYRVRIPAQTRVEANALCSQIRAARGSCAVLRS